MPGVKALKKIQLGVESTAGTEVNATVIYRGLGGGVDSRTIVFPDEEVGFLAGLDRSYASQHLAEIEFAETEATFQHLPYILEAGVAAEVATQDGAGSDYIYQYLWPTTSQNTLNTYTIEWGDDQQEYQSTYCFVKDFTLTGAAGEAVMMSANWVGRAAATGTYTAALTPNSVEEILFSKGTIDIDDTGTYPATTNKSSTLVSMELSVTTGFMEYFTADGQLYFTAHKQVMPEALLTVTFEHDGTATAEYAKFQADTTRNIRLQFTGSAVTTPGTTYSNHEFIIDAIGRYESFSQLDDADGNNQVTATLRIRHETSDAASLRFIVVNELSALA